MTDDIAARIAWIGADWGTTRLRLFAFDDADEIIASRTDGPGMNALKPDEFEPALARLGWTFRDTGKLPPVLICGMAGARQGWMEAPYVELPATLDLIVGGAVTVPCAASVGPVRILPGLCYRYPPAPDVVRGEETQALGLVATAGPGDVTLVMPGTHSKWLDLRDGVVTSSHTFMTGEVFDLLARQSVLRHSLTADGFDDTAFLRGVREGAHRPDLLLSRLF
ncbi:MAG: 2-dehydro-3-deoxygalactonokinase, partial [Rhodobiaceae bacterium]|nr:2-dehydro-3-deoxygalactonokinase [Rhodobiaceae bacterium]